MILNSTDILEVLTGECFFKNRYRLTINQKLKIKMMTHVSKNMMKIIINLSL